MVIDIDDFEVLTENGFKDFSGIKKSIKDRYFHISFDDGTELKCSYEHRIKKNDIFVRAYELTVDMFIQGKQITDIQLINEEVEVFDLLDVKDTHSYITNDITSHNCAFVENFDAFFTSTYPTISSGETTKVILVSTPKGLNHYYHIWSNAIAGKNGYTPIMVKWTQVPGRDEKWRQDTLASLNFDMEKFNQEYECDFVGSSSTLIAGWKLKQLEASIPRHTHDGLTVFEHPNSNHVYTCVVDVSRGKGLDYSAFSILDVTGMPYKQVCTYRNNLITPIDFAEIVYRVAKSYNKAATLVEINDLGEQVSTSLQYDFEYDNLLYTEHAGRGGKKISSGFGPNVDRGVRTTKTVKSVGCSILKLLLEQNQLIINDKHTISELSTFSRKGNSYEAEPGYHDDMVMCLVLFAWLSDQAYFKDLTDINTLAMLRDKSESDIDNDMIPFGFIEDGRDDDTIIDMTTPRGSWMFGDDRF